MNKRHGAAASSDLDERISVRLIEALADVWSAIRRRHPDVPGVVIIPAPAPRGRMNVLGHFAPVRWRKPDTDDRLIHEVVVVAEHLDRSANDIVETLLHEAAHALHHNRFPGVSDCSVSQYHNRRFKAAAEELGLHVHQVKHYGFAHTTMPELTASRYDLERHRLASVLVHRRKPGPKATNDGPTGATPVPTTPTTARPSRSRKATCVCGFIIRVSRKTLRDTVIRCDSCGQPFTLT